MTYEELKEKAKEMGYERGFTVSNSIQFEKVDCKYVFAINGCIHLFHRGALQGITIATKRTPDQMYHIMEGLR